MGGVSKISQQIQDLTSAGHRSVIAVHWTGLPVPPEKLAILVPWLFWRLFPVPPSFPIVFIGLHHAVLGNPLKLKTSLEVCWDSVCALDPCDLYLTRLPSLPLRQARMDRLYKQRDFHCRYHSHRHYKCCKRLYMPTCKIMMTLCKKWRYKKERKTKCLFYFFFLACFHTFNAPFCF